MTLPVEGLVDGRFYLSSFEYRLNTFKNWPYTGQALCTAEKLAESGFYKTGNPDGDSTQCFVCCKELDCWEPDDDPHQEHEKHSPACPFLNSKLYENMTFPEALEMDMNRYSNYLSKLEDNIIEEWKRDVDIKFKQLTDHLVRQIKKGNRKVRSSNTSNASTLKRKKKNQSECSSIVSDESIRSTRKRTCVKHV